MSSTLRRPYYLAECECGWTEDGWGVGRGREVAMARRDHAKECGATTRLSRTLERVWDPREKGAWT